MTKIAYDCSDRIPHMVPFLFLLVQAERGRGSFESKVFVPPPFGASNVQYPDFGPMISKVAGKILERDNVHVGKRTGNRVRHYVLRC